jgi:SAM-dependent methyltransferase
VTATIRNVVEVTRATRARSFGRVAEAYDRYRPGPPPAAVAWILPAPCGTALDLGAGTGALTRLLGERASQVVAGEPDPRMIEVLASHSPTVGAVRTVAEHLPLAPATVDAVVVSSAWHWMDSAATVAEIARVLRPGGVFGVMWSGPDRTVGWVSDLLGNRDPSPGEPDRRTGRRLELPDGSPFDGPERTVISWSLPRTPEQLVGLAGTYSSMITMAPDHQAAELERIRARLAAAPQVAGRGSVDLPMSCRCWRAVRH